VRLKLIKQHFNQFVATTENYSADLIEREGSHTYSGENHCLRHCFLGQLHCSEQLRGSFELSQADFGACLRQCFNVNFVGFAA
jgi:hypothetical protein